MKSLLACVQYPLAEKLSSPSLLTTMQPKCLFTQSPMAARIGPCAASRAVGDGATLPYLFESVL